MEIVEKRPLQGRAIRIKRIARIGSLLCLCLAILIPVGIVGGLWSTGPDALAQGFGIEASSFIEEWKRISVIIILAIPAFVFSVSLLWLRTAFLTFGSGDYFSSKAFNALLWFSKWLGASVFLSVVCQTLAPLWLGKPSLSIQIGSSEFMTLGIAALIYLFANILALASDVEAENRQFV